MRNKKIKSKELDTLEELHVLEIERTALIHKLQKNELLTSLKTSTPSAPINNFKISKLEIDVTFYKFASLILVFSNVLLINLLLKKNNQLNATNKAIADYKAIADAAATNKTPIGFKSQNL